MARQKRALPVLEVAPQRFADLTSITPPDFGTTLTPAADSTQIKNFTDRQ